MPVPQATSPLAERIHNTVLQMLGSALLKAEMAEQLGRLGRQDEVPGQLLELRAALEQTVVELRAIMAELRRDATLGSLKNPGA
jgi:signal transduction histidine kinase